MLRANRIRGQEAGRCGPIAVLGCALALGAGCKVGPDYVKPAAPAPAGYKEGAGWKLAQPGDELARGTWWRMFSDAQLNAFEEQVDISNQNLAVAEAQYRQASALVRVARAGYYPTVTASVSATYLHSSSSAFRGFTGTTGGVPTPGVPTPGVPTPGGTTTGGATNNTFFSLPVDLSWTPDLWGRIRRTVEANEANAQASAADLESARLSAHGLLAQDYFQLRSIDLQQKLLRAAVADYDRFLTLTKNRYAAGVASRAEVLQAETQLQVTQAQEIDLGVTRAQLEHAIAVLLGKPAPQVSIPSSPLTGQPPAVPIHVPSELLERRPDIAAAERRVAAANAQIGVVKAAFYPQLTLSATGGFQSTNLTNWLTLPSRFWSVGPALAETIFEGGLRRAQTEQARAAYDATVASYRQTVLVAFQEVEDNLAALRILEAEGRVQDQAADTARRALAITTNQYKAGTASYLDVLISGAAALNAERIAADVLGRRMIATVLLIQTLGGGWQVADLPTPKETGRRGSPPRHEGK